MNRKTGAWRLALWLCLVMALVPVYALAEPTGIGRENAWDVSAEGSSVFAYLEQNNSDNSNPTYTLIFTGTGASKDYAKASECPWYAAYGTAITKGIVEKGVTALGNRAFVTLSNLTSVTLPEGLLSIGYSCFNATGLPTISFPESLQEIGQYAFYRSQLGGKIVIPESVTKIDAHAFNGSKIESVQLPKGLTVLGGGAFTSCASLKQIPTIPAGITSLGAVFQNCTSISEVTIPSHVTSLNLTFGGCTGLTKVTIPQNITSYKGAFYNCSNLTEVIIQTTAGIGEGNTNTAYGAFGGCTKLTKVVLPEEVDTVGGYAFKGCTTLTDFSQFKHIKKLEKGAFQNSGVSGNLILNTTSIGAFAFDGCKNIGPNIVLNASTTIGESAFRNCTGLTGVTYRQSGSSKLGSTIAVAMLNGGTMDENTVFDGSTLAIPTKLDHVFDGWYTKSDFSGDEAFTAEKGNTYYAKWTPKADASVSLTATPENTTYGEPLTLTATVEAASTTRMRMAQLDTVDFYARTASGDVPLGTADVIGGVARLKTTVVPAGQTEIYVNYGGSDIYKHIDNAASVTVNVKRAPLTAAYVSETITQGQAPALKVEVSGFVNGETVKTASGFVWPTVVNSHTDIGLYTLEPINGKADNYELIYVSGKLTIIAAPDVPKTGDHTPVTLLSAMLMLSGLGMLLMRRRGAKA